MAHHIAIKDKRLARAIARKASSISASMKTSSWRQRQIWRNMKIINNNERPRTRTRESGVSAAAWRRKRRRIENQ